MKRNSRSNKKDRKKLRRKLGIIGISNNGNGDFREPSTISMNKKVLKKRKKTMILKKPISKNKRLDNLKKIQSEDSIISRLAEIDKKYILDDESYITELRRVGINVEVKDFD